MAIKKRFINRQTLQHGIQLTYRELLMKIDDTTVQYWNGSSVTLQHATVLKFEQALHDLAYAYNLPEFPVKKTDERVDKWITGFSNIGFDPVVGMFIINFTLIDDITQKTLGKSKFVP